MSLTKYVKFIGSTKTTMLDELISRSLRFNVCHLLILFFSL
jgi:hypothetical protein